jgi:hypothetical protein
MYRTACPRCKEVGRDDSNDNLCVFDDGGMKCYACGYYIHPGTDEKGVPVERKKKESKPLTKEQGREIWHSTSFDDTGYRGIEEETNKLYGVRTGYCTETGDVELSYYPVYDETGITGYKIRRHPKKIYSKGKVKDDGYLFGQQLFKEKQGHCLIVEGEADALAAYQMLNRKAKVAVVSPTLGVEDTSKKVKLNYKLFEQFKTITVGLDSDEAGQKEQAIVAALLPIGKVKLAKWRHKDPNDYLLKGEEDKFCKDFWDAEEYKPANVIDSHELLQHVYKRATLEKIPLPPFAHDLQKLMAGGIPLGYNIIIAAYTGVGKTTVTNELTLFWLQHSPHRPCIISLESDTGEYGTNIISAIIKKKVDCIEDNKEKVKLLDSRADEYNKILGTNFEESTFTMIDHQGSLSSEEMQQKIEYARVVKGCKLFIIDPITLGLSGKDNRAMDEFTAWQVNYTKQHMVSFINVCHIRKADSKSAHSTGGEVVAEDIKGSGSFTQTAACTILLRRNLMAEDETERNTTTVSVPKCRWTGRTGKAGKWFYDNDRHELTEYKEEEDY